MTKSTEKLLKF